MPTPHLPTLAVRRVLRRLGADIYDARRRRRLTAALVADRALTSRQTLHRVEKGDHTVSIGIYAAVLHALGLLDRLAEVASLSSDEAGAAIERERLPKRIHPPKPKRTHE